MLAANLHKMDGSNLLRLTDIAILTAFISKSQINCLQMTTCKYWTTDSENSSRKGAFFSVVIYSMESKSPESPYIFIYKVIQWIPNYYKLLPAESMVPPRPMLCKSSTGRNCCHDYARDDFSTSLPFSFPPCSRLPEVC
ncbi:hypothetical protein CDAR_483711 [Caerostris darwini]|uniref:Uncharacterized protein n=1 Tax=Caerostris darwini TaxID=1538125 RepID=A0AAV4TPR3_9ARAC|nr:hypothetical protein CDAR_483711 [Caerostris darwini]